jgi:hypothetical protein
MFTHAWLRESMMQVSDQAIKSVPDIILAAATSTLGILALIVLALAVLGFLFFKDAPTKTKAGSCSRRRRPRAKREIPSLHTGWKRSPAMVKSFLAANTGISL